MRIISGKYRGRVLKGYDILGTRPTMDRVKESLYGMIQAHIKDSTVLDLFAGSGSLGLEAISNGAKRLIMVDNNIEVIKAINNNIKSFDDDIEVLHIDYKKYLKTTEDKFDIIFLDPPYDSNLMNKSLKIIEERNLLNDGGLVVCEYENNNPITNLKLVKEKSYGSKKIKIFRS